MAVLNKQTLRPGERIRVLIVDDSVVIRTLVTQVLSEDPQLEVVGTASNGVIGLQRVAQLEPHVLTLDIEMPQMDGLELLRHLRTLHPHLRVIMFSTLTERGATATFEALSLGAHDYVTKPANGGAIDRSAPWLGCGKIWCRRLSNSSLHQQAHSPLLQHGGTNRAGPAGKV